ncbi:MAG: protein kinase [Acidobacteriota bacterium]
MKGQSILDRYEIREEIGKGGRGVVYLAQDILLERKVAIKIMLPDAMTISAKERFRYEARTTAKLAHPSIAPIYDFGDHDGNLFIVMPVIAGQTLRVMIEEQSLVPEKVVEVAIQIADALDHSHTECVIHRDIKPENVMVEWRDQRAPQVKVLDFGLATDSHAAPSEDKSTIYGTVLYVSPEQLLGEEIDARSDIYSLGVLLYETLLGQHPLKGNSKRSIFERILMKRPATLRQRGLQVSEALDKLVMSCMEKERSDRPVSARQMLRELMRIRRSERREARDSGRVPRRSLGTGSTESGPISFADRLGDLLMVRGEYLEAEEAYRQARTKRRSAEGELPADVEARYLLKLGQLALKLGRYDETRQRCRTGLDLIASESPGLAAELYALAGLEACMCGDYDRATRSLEAGRSALNDAEADGWDLRRVATALLRTEGNLTMGEGRLSAAAEAYREGLALCEELGDRWERSIALFNLGEVFLEQGDTVAALEYLERALDEKAAIGDRWGLAYTHHALARLYLRRSAVDDADKEARLGLRLAHEIGDPKITARLELIQGRLALARGVLERATGHFRMALSEAERISAQPEIARSRAGLTEVWNRLGIGGQGPTVDSGP